MPRVNNTVRRLASGIRLLRRNRGRIRKIRLTFRTSRFPRDFKLHGWLVPLKSRTTLPSSVRSEPTSAAKRPLGKPASRATQRRKHTDSTPERPEVSVARTKQSAFQKHFRSYSQRAPQLPVFASTRPLAQVKQPATWFAGWVGVPC